MRSSLCVFREKVTRFSTAALDGRVLFWDLATKAHIKSKLPKSLVTCSLFIACMFD